MNASLAPAPHVVHVMTSPVSLAFLSGQVRHLVERGWRVTVITSPGDDLERFARAEGCSAWAVPMARALDPVGDLRALGELVPLLRSLRPDIVHAHTPKGGLLGMMAATAARVPVRVFHCRGSLLLTAEGWRRPLFRATEWLTAALADHVIAVSASLRDTLASEGVLDASRTTILLGGSGQGVDARGLFHPAHLPHGSRASVRASLGLDPDDRVALFVGRLVREKGIVELRDAWRAVRAAEPRARLVIAGPSEARDAVPDEVLRDLAADTTVRLTGALPASALPALYDAGDVLVLPTWREGFPNVALEAAAMRRPVIATRVPGCVDAVDDGVTGALVPARAPDDLAHALLRYLQQPELAQAHGFEGRKRVLRSFERGRFPPAIEAFYHDALRGARR